MHVARLGMLIGVLVVVVAGGWWLVHSRMQRCAAVPWLADDLLPNAALAAPASASWPDGWGRRTGNGTEVQHPSTGRGFDLDGDDRGLQLIGIANYVETPPIAVSPGTGYCFSGFALTDEASKGATRVQVLFRWLASDGALVAEAAGAWQPVALWTPDARGWSPVAAAFRAPEGATTLVVRLQPAADNRVYFDAMHIRHGAGAAPTPLSPPSPVQIGPWPNGATGAVSFSFDWESTMGGPIHSRSLVADDPNNAVAPRQRGMAMRQGITTTLALFEPLGIRATYYATGYNFLNGNPNQQRFMGDPTFGWATVDHGWSRDWSGQPWFGTDPYGTIGSDADYYFGDLIGQLQRANQDIQTHTFAHLYGGYASPDEWSADFTAWADAAKHQNVAPATSLAFPWSGSGGMSDANWQVLEKAGIRSVVRTNRSQANYQITNWHDPHCRAVPGHEQILACPDFYLHNQQTANQSLALIDDVIAKGGAIDLWAHTEEVVSPEQIAAWGEVVRYAAQQRDAGKLWIAPMREIAAWQQALSEVSVEALPVQNDATMRLRISNASTQEQDGIPMTFPFSLAKATVNGIPLPANAIRGSVLTVSCAANTTIEVEVWRV